jgi:hypothetical protein
LEEAMKKEDIITETKGNKKVQQLYEELLRGVNNYK